MANIQNDLATALSDLLDGENWYDIQYSTGLPEDRCKEIIKLCKAVKVHYQDLVNALCDLTDGERWYDIPYSLGLSEERCKEIIELRDAVKADWVRK